MARTRLDQVLLARGLAETRSKAQALVLAGLVFTGERRLDKPGMQVAGDISLDVRNSGSQWVSRGAHKLLQGLDAFEIPVQDMAALDIGASTGGFTQVLLSRGARRVIAVDVGYGQLAWELRKDPRVIVLEKQNARELDERHVPEPVDIVVCDASFISLRTVLSAPLALTCPRAWLVALIKPQFEAGRESVGKGGVVRDPEVHQRVCDEVAEWLESQPGWTVAGVCESPIRGPKGNREFLIGATRQP